MNLKNKWALIAGTVLVSGALMTGAALADGAATATTPATPSTAEESAKPTWAERLAEMVTSGKLTQGQADALTQIEDLRKAAMEKLKGETDAVINQAVTDGKITQEQADQLKERGGRRFFGGHGKGGKHGGGREGFGRKPLTQEEQPAESPAK